MKAACLAWTAIGVLAAHSARGDEPSSRVFELHGYFRSGFGLNSHGWQQVAFWAPGAAAKYRLGNEAETYGEIGLDANWINPDHSDTWFKTSLKLAVVASRSWS